MGVALQANKRPREFVVKTHGVVLVEATEMILGCRQLALE
jgi:hypothetical protein